MRRLLATALTAGAVVLTACSQPNFFGTRQPVVTAYLRLFGASDTPLEYPAAFGVVANEIFAARAEVSLSGNAAYDVVIDVDASVPSDPRIKIIPVRKWVPAPTLGLPSVGLLRSSVAFDAANEAPVGGFVFDSTLVVRPGETFMLQTNRCLGFQTTQYTKAVVDSVRLSDRAVKMRVATDQNCGQRQFPTSDFPPR